MFPPTKSDVLQLVSKNPIFLFGTISKTFFKSSLASRGVFTISFRGSTGEYENATKSPSAKSLTICPKSLFNT